MSEQQAAFISMDKTEELRAFEAIASARRQQLEQLEATAKRLVAAYRRADRHGIDRSLAALDRLMPMEGKSQ